MVEFSLARSRWKKPSVPHVHVWKICWLSHTHIHKTSLGHLDQQQLWGQQIVTQVALFFYFVCLFFSQKCDKIILRSKANHSQTNYQKKSQ